MSEDEIPVLKPGMDMVPVGQPQPIADETGRQLYADTRASVVRIITDKGVGTGFVVDDKGGIMTDFHVIEGAKEIVISAADGRRYKVGIDKIGDTSDLAVLRTLSGKSPGPAVTFGDSTALVPDQPLWGIGHPHGARTPYLSPGYNRFRSEPLNIFANDAPNRLDIMAATVSTWTPSEQSDFITYMTRPVLSILANQLPGNSGGPIFNAKREVVGVTQLGASGNQGYVGTSEEAAALLMSQPKFSVTHGFLSENWTESYKSSWRTDPALTATLTAGTAGLGYAGYRLASRVPRIAGIGLTLDGGDKLSTNASSFLSSTDSATSWRTGLKTGGSLLETAGGIAMLFPQARKFGAIAAIAGITTNTGSDFIKSRYVVTDISRVDGSPREPFSLTSGRHSNIFSALPVLPPDGGIAGPPKKAAPDVPPPEKKK